jgi:hypothetical protein
MLTLPALFAVLKFLSAKPRCAHTRHAPTCVICVIPKSGLDAGSRPQSEGRLRAAGATSGGFFLSWSPGSHWCDSTTELRRHAGLCSVHPRGWRLEVRYEMRPEERGAQNLRNWFSCR